MSLMNKAALAAAFAFLAFEAPPTFADVQWWGRHLPNGPSQFIFGYGSLINTASRNVTAGKPTFGGIL